MKIAVDMDDVIVDFTPHILACLRTEYGVRVPLDNIKEFTALGAVVESVTGIPGGLFGWLRGRDWLWAKAPAVEGAIGGIQVLRDKGHHIELVTTKPEWAEWTVWAWLGKWRPAAQAVQVVDQGMPKHKASDADMLIDDAPHNIDPWLLSGREALMFARPWNVRDGVSYRVESWADVIYRLGNRV